MVDNQHKQIKGYRDLTQEEITYINMCKETGIELGKLCDKVKAIPNIDPRWLAIARTDFQTGLMALIRSIARPETF